MAKHICNYLSNCCEEEVLHGSEIDFDDYGATGVCSSCHDYTGFSDYGHTPWDDDYEPKSRHSIVKDHDCDFMSMCCGARPVWELDHYLTGFCGSCHDGTGFECGVDENCTNNTNTILQEAYNKRSVGVADAIQ